MKENNKWICVVAYIIFFVPLLVDGENVEYKFHANQGLNLFILAVTTFRQPWNKKRRIGIGACKRKLQGN